VVAVGEGIAEERDPAGDEPDFRQPFIAKKPVLPRNLPFCERDSLLYRYTLQNSS